MALFLTIVLLVSCTAMAALLWVKHWELATGRLVLKQYRPRIGRAADTVLAAFEYHLPHLIRHLWKYFLHWMRVTARHSLAHALLAAENALERALHIIRHKTTPSHESTGTASAFLREVAAYKKKLGRRTRRLTERSASAIETRTPAFVAEGVGEEVQSLPTEEIAAN